MPREELKPTVRHVVEFDGREQEVLLPKAVIKSNIGDRDRIFMQLNLGGTIVPCYLSGRRKDFRAAYVTLDHSDREVGQAVQEHGLGAATELAKKKLLTPKVWWILKFESESGFSTRLREEIQELLARELPKMKTVQMKHENFARYWLTQGHAIPDANSQTTMNTIDASGRHSYFLIGRLGPVKHFLHVWPVGLK